MKIVKKQWSILSMLCIAALLTLPFAFTGCGQSNNGSSVSASGAGAADTSSSVNTTKYSGANGMCDSDAGKALYAGNCASCHGDLANTTVPVGTTVADIKAAMAAQASMGGINLSDDELADVAFALGDVNDCEKAGNANPDPSAKASASANGSGVLDVAGILDTGSLLNTGGLLNLSSLLNTGDLLGGNLLGGDLLGGGLLGGGLLGGSGLPVVGDVLGGGLLGGDLLGGGLLGCVGGGGDLLGGCGGLVGNLMGVIDNTVGDLLLDLDVGGITSPIVAGVGNLLNATVYPTLLNPVLDGVMSTGRSVGTIMIPVSALLKPVNDTVNGVISTAYGVVATVNQAVGGEIKALLPMPLIPGKKCEDCHHSKLTLITMMADPGLNLKYPGLAADIPFVDNFYVCPDYTNLPDSMMTMAAKHPLWNGCVTCHGEGATFNPFPSDNWVPDSNPNDGPEVAKAFGSTNDASATCGKCHPDQAAAFNKGIMGTHRGHLWAFNFNDVEIEATNTEAQFYYNPMQPIGAGTDMERLPLDRNGKRMHAGYYQSRRSCSTCHQSCSDCHMAGPGNSPISTLGLVDITKGAAAELIHIDKSHTAVGVRVRATAATSVRRGGVVLLEMRKGYIPGVLRGIPYSVYEAGMDVSSHKFNKPTTKEQGNLIADLTQYQSIGRCWRCHFRTGAEFTGNYVNVVPNVNYSKKTLGHLQAGMTCTDCHKRSESMGYTSATSQSFAGTFESAANPSHAGGNPVGSTPKWDLTPNPIKVSCGLCHTNEGKALGVTGGLNWGPLVTERFQKIASVVKGTGPMTATAGYQTSMSHTNIKCEACHVQAQQNCWNCHIEKAEEVTALPFIGTNDVNVNLLPTIINVREAEGIPALTDEENCRLKEAPAANDSYNISLALTFPNSPNTVNKSVRFLARNNHGLVGSVVHCPSFAVGINNPTADPQPLNLDGGLMITKSGQYGEEGAVGDPTTSGEGSWYMESGHSIARTPDGEGYTACYNCHADTVRLGKEPITYYRKNPWIMQSIGVPEAIMPADHFANGSYKDGSGFNCNCHSADGLVHNGNFEGPWPMDILGDEEGGHTPPPTGPDGAALYGSRCASCHGALASSTKTGATFQRIKDGIAGPMAFFGLGDLTDEQIHAIAHALGGE